MPKPQDDVEELHSDGAESNEVEVNRDLFKDIKFYLHESIKKRFSRNNLTRDIEVGHEPLDLTPLANNSFFVCRGTAELYITLIMAATQFLSMSCSPKRRYYNLSLTIRTMLN